MTIIAAIVGVFLIIAQLMTFAINAKLGRIERNLYILVQQKQPAAVDAALAKKEPEKVEHHLSSTWGVTIVIIILAAMTLIILYARSR
jgi:hypothetical protein